MRVPRAVGTRRMKNPARFPGRAHLSNFYFPMQWRGDSIKHFFAAIATFAPRP
jgi:hypothetical protein